MDTNANDRVPASLTSYIFTDEDKEKVYLRLNFYCKEYGGDGTTYEGSKDLLVFEANPGLEITSLEVTGSPVLSFNRVTRGRNWDLTDFANEEELRPTYWKKLQYRIDSQQHDDSPHVGVSGQIEYKVETGPKARATSRKLR